MPAVLRPVLDSLLVALPEVRAGTLTPAHASAMAALAGAIVKVWQAGVVEERLAALEAADQARRGSA